MAKLSWSVRVLAPGDEGSKIQIWLGSVVLDSVDLGSSSPRSLSLVEMNLVKLGKWSNGTSYQVAR